ncbi:hypothetical protein BDP81DRAFT_445007 [Colletotrichum phormii]|uniref:Uncharacterized protein n=1 Tax=Colletotrichum phormii TaxID=359342 RepID=A0AAJ0EK09_9PEZI|nr:uncharacterized protein BDP81DRAFT_445007 [Colletotrichum phormii]KAK1654092.1 hypothetical protein BDP81DRAFT_445007 [Colletotrichum phormii]
MSTCQPFGADAANYSASAYTSPQLNTTLLLWHNLADLVTRQQRCHKPWLCSNPGIGTTEGDIRDRRYLQFLPAETLPSLPTPRRALAYALRATPATPATLVRGREYSYATLKIIELHVRLAGKELSSKRLAPTSMQTRPKTVLTTFTHRIPAFAFAPSLVPMLHSTASSRRTSKARHTSDHNPGASRSPKSAPSWSAPSDVCGHETRRPTIPNAALRSSPQQTRLPRLDISLCNVTGDHRMGSRTVSIG